MLGKQERICIQVSPCYHSLLTFIQSYHGKVTPISAFHAEKIAVAVLLFVFRIAFPASLFCSALNLSKFKQ